MHRIVGELDLSEDQKALAMELREEARSGHEDERAERDQSFQVMLTELGKAEPDARVLHGLVDQKLDSIASRMHDGVDAFLTLHATFTPEQRETLVTEMESRREEAKARHEQGREEMDEEGRGRGRR